MLEWYLLTRGISAREFARQMGMHNTTIYRVINGTNLPDSRTTLKIVNWMLDSDEESRT